MFHICNNFYSFVMIPDIHLNILIFTQNFFNSLFIVAQQYEPISIKRLVKFVSLSFLTGSKSHIEALLDLDLILDLVKL